MRFQAEYFTNEKIILLALSVAEALRAKALEPKWAHLNSVAEQLERDLTTNLNRALRSAMSLARAHSLNI